MYFSNPLSWKILVTFLALKKKKKEEEEYTKWSLEFSLFNSECYVYFVTIETI